MARFGFIGGSYQSSSPSVDAERCINLLVENVESDGKSAQALYRTPGTRVFTDLGGTSVPEGFYEPSSGRCFAVSGTTFFEVFANGASKALGTVVNDFTKPYICGSNLQLLIVSGGAAYSFTLATSKFAPITIDSNSSTAIQGPVSQCDYADGYFVVLLRNSSKFQISTLLDDTQWSGLDVAQISLFPENIVGFKINLRSLWFWGPKRSQVYYNSGNLNFPFQPIPGGFIENGLLAPDSPVRMDNTVFWLGADERGSGMAWRGNGYTGQRISTHATETIWQSYPRMDDCRTYSYQENGHTFAVFYFPSAKNGVGATWVYDASSGLWHERMFYDGSAHRSMCHAYAFGKHLVGDRSSGKIYEMSSQFLDDSGDFIIRNRTAPYIADEDRWLSFNKIQFEVNTGNGPMPPLKDGRGNPRDPQIILDWSDDGARTWSQPRILSVGEAGHYQKRVIARRLGRCWGTRGRVFRVQCSDPVDWAFVDAYVNAPPDLGPKRRLVSQVADQA